MKSILERLIRPDTHDEVRTFSDAELKAAIDAAAAELKSRGWDIGGSAFEQKITFQKRIEL